ncbi:inner membrane protein YghQ [Novosphingobium sp. Rr 2-17]|uniref:lipopolysaccharide biosynthesis protein n=1 Tax=Novosphingobium sp. Rr 2-17 TaxID=555793 RepID=UPI00026991E3|nr:lipopolysaccharide biosynthesis protein [Novosphingobium sp. Rr 2-17]EIZ79311.1 inner membrane protein YghQ [Novosphingobium sp. Rr 2-17]
MTDRPTGRVRRIFASLGLVLSGKAGAGILSLGYLVLAARYLGPKDYGVLVLVHAYVTAVCGVIEFPSWQAIVRYGAEANSKGEAHRLSRLLRFGAKVELAGGACAVVAAMALVPFVGPHLGWSAKAMAFAPYYSFAVLGSVRSTPTGYLQLCGRFDLLGLHSLVQPAVRLIGTLIVIGCGWGVKSFLFAWLLAAMAEFAAMWGMGLWIAARRMGAVILRPEPGRVTEENAGIWRFLLASNADVTLSDLTGRVAPLVIGWVMGPAMAGLFAVAQRATVILAQPAQILGSTSYAELAHIVAGGHGGKALRQTLLKVVGIALLAAVPVVLIVGLFPSQIIHLMAGSAYGAAAGVMIALVAARAVSLIGPPCTSALTALGHPARSMWANLLSSLAFLPLLPWLLHHFGLLGAGIQAIAQAVAASALLAILVWRTSGQQVSGQQASSQ